MKGTMTRRALLAGVSATALLAGMGPGEAALRRRRGVHHPPHRGPHEPIPPVRIHNYGRRAVPHWQVSFFQPFAPGDRPKGGFVEIERRGGVAIPSQQNQESRWQDGSTKGAAFSFI
jgi:hypothetical protein